MSDYQILSVDLNPTILYAGHGSVSGTLVVWYGVELVHVLSQEVPTCIHTQVGRLFST